MCLYPKLILNRKYTKTIKNGGIIPPIKDDRVKYVPVGCGNCIECKKQKSRNWTVRLQEEIKYSQDGKFITLTFSDTSIATIYDELQEDHAKKGMLMPEGYELDNAIATYAVRQFLERWRYQFKKSLRHWFVTELGHKGTENIHLHGIIWTNQSMEIVEQIWKYGMIWKGKLIGKILVNYVSAKTISYICKYITKTDEDHPGYNSKILTSPGIGGKYIKSLDAKKNLFDNDKTDETYKTNTGNRLALPTYYRNHLYTEEQREQLWLNKLDKQERWVLGNKIDISENDNEYNQALKYARVTNEILGYKNNEKSEDEEEYERQKRYLKQQTRIAKANKNKNNNNNNNTEENYWDKYNNT